MYKSVKDCSSREAVLFQRLAFEKEWSDSGTAESLARRKAGTPKTKSLIEKNVFKILLFLALKFNIVVFLGTSKKSTKPRKVTNERFCY